MVYFDIIYLLFGRIHMLTALDFYMNFKMTPKFKQF